MKPATKFIELHEISWDNDVETFTVNAAHIVAFRQSYLRESGASVTFSKSVHRGGCLHQVEVVESYDEINRLLAGGASCR